MGIGSWKEVRDTWRGPNRIKSPSVAHMPPSMLDAFGLLRLTAGWCLIGSEPKMPPGWLDALLLRRAEGSGCSGADESSKVKASLRTMGAPAQAMDSTSTQGVDTGRDTGASAWL